MTNPANDFVVSVNVIPRDDGGEDYEFRGLDEDRVYADALNAKNAFARAMVPAISGQFRDITSGEWVVRLSLKAGPLQ